MEYYIVAYILVYILAILYRKKMINIRLFNFGIIRTIVICFPIILLAAYRWFVGTDFNNYITLYDYFGKMNVGQYFSNMINVGPGFYILIKVAYSIGSIKVYFGLIEFVVDFFIVNGLCYWHKKGILDFENPLILYLLIFFPHSLNISRQMIAVSILFYAAKYLEEEHYFKYLLFVFGAILFHSTAVIGVVILILYLFHKAKIKQKKLWISMIVIMEILVLIVANRGMAIFNLITVSTEKTGTISILQILLQVVIFVVYGVYYKWMKKDQFWRFNVLMLLNSMAIYIFLYSYSWAFRISYYFNIFQLFIVGQTIRKIDKYSANKQTANILKILLIGILAVIAYVLYVYLKFDEIIPYQINDVMR